MEQKDYSPLLSDITKMYINEDYAPIPRYIVCAACAIELSDGTEHIVAGIRHWDKVMHSQRKLLDTAGVEYKIVHRKQGFLDQYGYYVDRETAMQICKANGQKVNMERNSHKTDLFSEGLY